MMMLGTRRRIDRLIDKFTPEDNLKTREQCEKAIQLKPNYGRARACD
jgi:hypothetical protein